MNLNTVFGSPRKNANRTTTNRPDTPQAPPAGTNTPSLALASRWVRNLGLQVSDTLDHGGLQKRAVADLTEWGLSQAQAEAIASAPDYALAHAQLFGGEPPAVLAQGSAQQGLSFTPKDLAFSLGEQERARKVCLAWLSAAPAQAAFRLLNAVLPQLPQAAHELLQANVNSLIEGADAEHGTQVVAAIVALADGGWSTANSASFVPEDLRGPLMGLVSKLDPAAGLRVQLITFKQRENSLALGELAQDNYQLAHALMKELDALWESANALGAGGLGIDAVQAAKALAARCRDSAPLQAQALALARKSQQARTQSALAAMAPWCSITTDDSGQALLNVEVRADDPTLKSAPSRKAAESTLREFLRAQVDGPDGLSWADLNKLIHAIGEATPAQKWLSTDHWTQLACGEASRTGKLAPLQRVLNPAEAGAVSNPQLQRVIRRIAAAIDKPAVQQELMTKVAELLPPRDAQTLSLHRAWLRQWAQLTESHPKMGRTLWAAYLKQHPLPSLLGLPHLASVVMDALAAKSLQGAGRAKAKSRLALADGLVKCLFTSLGDTPAAPQRKRDLQQQFALLSQAVGHLPAAQRRSCLQRVREACADELAALRERLKRKAQIPLELVALHGGVCALQEIHDGIAAPVYDENHFASPEVEFLREWSRALVLQASGRDVEAWTALRLLRSTFRIRSAQHYAFDDEPSALAEAIFEDIVKDVPSSLLPQKAETPRNQND